ncbi:MAG TPA: SAM-dependent methyltransferase [Longimicrobium sp.]|nr:SAM-dependent methyltransferase [Longimicrobium sp.]
MIAVEPIAYVRGPRASLEDDAWGRVESAIELVESFGADCLAGLEEFSHAEILFHFHAGDPGAVERGTRHPRGNPAWPRVGIFAQRAAGRPNRIGATIVEIRGVEGRVLRVAGLDAVDGTPVLDIKPVMAEFLPRTPLRQPAWSRELMRGYW